MFIIKTLIKAAVFPPGFFFISILVGLAIIRRRRSLGISLMSVATIVLFLLSTSAITNVLEYSLEQHAPLDLDQISSNGGAIVVLTSGVRRDAPEYGVDTASLQSIARARYAAHLHKRTGVPILLVGGKPLFSTLSESEALRRVLVEEWKVPVRWLEETAKNTAESAVNSHEILTAEGITQIFLVTDFWHMMRAENAFVRAGFDVIPAPMGFRSTWKVTPFDFMPLAGAMLTSSVMMNEWFGLAWYKLKGKF